MLFDLRSSPPSPSNAPSNIYINSNLTTSHYYSFIQSLLSNQTQSQPPNQYISANTYPFNSTQLFQSFLTFKLFQSFLTFKLFQSFLTLILTNQINIITIIQLTTFINTYNPHASHFTNIPYIQYTIITQSISYNNQFSHTYTLIHIKLSIPSFTITHSAPYQSLHSNINSNQFIHSIRYQLNSSTKTLISNNHPFQITQSTHIQSYNTSIQFTIILKPHILNS